MFNMLIQCLLILTMLVHYTQTSDNCTYWYDLSRNQQVLLTVYRRTVYVRRSVWSTWTVSGTSSSRWCRRPTTSADRTAASLRNTSFIHGTQRLNRQLSGRARLKVSRHLYTRSFGHSVSGQVITWY